MKQYIKMNKNDNNLSLGNFCNLIKDLSINRNAAIQSQIVCDIFDIDSVNESTINNYCVGIRRIKDEYKEIYIRLKSKYSTNPFVMIGIINNLRSILNGKLETPSYSDSELVDKINSDIKIIELSNRLFNIAKNDISITSTTRDTLSSLFHSKKYFDFISSCLFFIVLEKKQPVYEDKEKSMIIDKIIENTNISSNDLTKYINLKFAEEINYHHKLTILAKENNPYANMELGINEYKGYIANEKRYNLAYEYFKAAAEFNHPNALYMKARIAIEFFKKDEKQDLLKAADLGSVAALNFLGVCYKLPHIGFEKNLKTAISYFNQAASKNYSYAYNNLGLLEEESGNYDESISYFEKSATVFESYACNKMGLHYLKTEDFSLAYDFFNKGINTDISNCCYFNYYNLASVFYENGFKSLNIPQNISLAISYYEIAAKYGNYDSMIKLAKYYYEKYKLENSTFHHTKLVSIKAAIEANEKFNLEDKTSLEKYFSDIKLQLDIS